jgi:prefoldin subunit 5
MFSLLFMKGKFSIFAVGAAAVAGLFRRCKELKDKLEETTQHFDSLSEKVGTLTLENEKMAKERNESEGSYASQLRGLKDEFEEEWALREREWQDKLTNKEEDAQQRLDEIASWQSELARLRTEAIAIRSAIEKVRSRSTSPGRSESGGSLFSEKSGKDKENNGNTWQEVKSRDPLAVSNNNNRGRSPLRV